MENETKEKLIIPLIISFIFLGVYLYFLIFFIEKNYWWIFPLFIYLLLFVMYDKSLKEKKISKNLMIKNRDDIENNCKLRTDVELFCPTKSKQNTRTS